MCPPRVPPQLSLPVPIEPSADPLGSPAERTLARLLARLGHDAPGEALVHLRCPGCAWLRTLRLQVPGRARPSRVERMLPRVPLRHWVFSLGESAQPRLAEQAGLRRRVARACVSAVLAWQRRAAARHGVTGPLRGGAITAIHRVGAALDANVHVHALVLDGVYALDPHAAPVFHPLPPPRRRDLRRLVAELRSTIDALVARAAQPLRTRTRVVQRMVEGPVVRPVAAPGDGVALVQRCGELDVRAGPSVAPDDQVVRARLCRYLGREPFDPSALGLGAHGRLRYRLGHPFSDGTTHVELSAEALVRRLERLAAGELRPPLSFHGVLAPGAVATWVCAQRARQLPLLEPSTIQPATAPAARPSPRSTDAGPTCPRCSTPMEIIGVEPAGRRAA